MIFLPTYYVTIACPHRWFSEMVGQPGKTGAKEYTEEFDVITKDKGTRVWLLGHGCLRILLALVFSNTKNDKLYRTVALRCISHLVILILTQIQKHAIIAREVW